MGHGGQDKWLVKRAKFMKGVDGAVIVYSNTDIQSYLNMDKWVDEVYQYANKSVPIIIVRNKSDLPPIKENLFPDYLGEIAKNLIVTSAKMGENVEEMFLRIAGVVVKGKAKEIKG